MRSVHFSRVLRAGVAIAVIAMAIRYLARNWAEFRDQPLVLEPHPTWLVLAFLTVLATFVLLIEAWRRVVLSLGEDLAPLPAARIWTLANLGKYLPGKVWAIASAAVLAEAAGVRKAVAVTAALVLQALALGSGLLVVATTAPGTLVSAGRTLVLGTILLGALALGSIATLASAPALAWLQRHLPPSWPPLQPLRPSVVLGALLVNVVAWGAYGASLVFLARGLMPDAVPDYRLSVGVFTLSYLVGLVAVFAPAGVGARESLFILLLSQPLGPKAAVGLAIASRILFTLAELGAALPFLVWRRSSTASATESQP